MTRPSEPEPDDLLAELRREADEERLNRLFAELADEEVLDQLFDALSADSPVGRG